jgi:hypothetical protein
MDTLAEISNHCWYVEELLQHNIRFELRNDMLRICISLPSGYETMFDALSGPYAKTVLSYLEKNCSQDLIKYILKIMKIEYEVYPNICRRRRAAAI